MDSNENCLLLGKDDVYAHLRKSELPSFAGQWLGCVLNLKPIWSAGFEKNKSNTKFRVTYFFGSQEISLREITQVQSIQGIFWSRVSILAGGELITLHGLSHAVASELKEEVDSQVMLSLYDQARSSEPLVNKFLNAVHLNLPSNRYLRYSDSLNFVNQIKLLDKNRLIDALKIVNNPNWSHVYYSPTFELDLRKIVGIVESTREFIDERNSLFVDKELVECEKFFDDIEKSELTLEQRKAAIIFEDRNLLVAAAGSGKSSTLVGKFGYAIHRGIYEPNQIIGLAFNRDAAAELNERVRIRLKPWLNNSVVKAHTFHALGMHIINKVHKDQKKKVSCVSGSESKRQLEEKNRLGRAIKLCMENDQNFSHNWLLFLSLCPAPVPSSDTFRSKTEYEQFVDSQRKARKNGEPAVFQTLTNEVVRSHEELAIANWLYINGVQFCYEREFPYPTPVAWQKTYVPDFYYPDIDVWHEHFALDAKGQSPFKDYEVKAANKRVFLTETIDGHWFETQSWEYFNGTIFDQLERQLKARGQKFNRRSDDEILKSIMQLRQTDAVDLVLKVLKQVKSNGYTREEFNRCLGTLKERFRADCFGRVFLPIFEAYKDLMEKEGKIDFDDMIIKAAEYLEQGLFKSPYHFILVDEFQDMSAGRSRLIKALLKQHEHSILFGVGDDWQAINGFAGSDLNLFMKFEDYFGKASENQLTKTFRCSQGIAYVASQFIQQNAKGQKKKVVLSELDPTIDKVVDLIDVKNEASIFEEIASQISILASNFVPTEKQKKLSVYILSRYSLKNTKGITAPQLQQMSLCFAESVDIKFMTIHKSKGLEADVVFVLGLHESAYFSFPSRFTSDPLIEMFSKHTDLYPFAEERRLFYVALTRSKKKVFVLFDKKQCSRFASELMDVKYRPSVSLRGENVPQPCAKCQSGTMVLRPGKNNSYFWGCSNFPKHLGGCRSQLTLDSIPYRSFRQFLVRKFAW